MSIAEVARIYHLERERAAELSDIPRISPEWINFAAAEVTKRSE
jgi:hypothetical protein